MWYLWLGLAISVAIFLVCALKSSDYGNFGWILGDLLSLCAIAVFGLMLLIVPISRHVDRNNCHKFATNTNRTTKFVEYNWFQWECLTNTSTGRWIPIDQLREFGK